MEIQFVVVVNAEEQYSIWRNDCPVPPGWSLEGMQGPLAECLKYIDTVWVDMTPASLRRANQGSLV
ncbi:MbtH family protein [Paraburkholderia unamae]|uniref:MbtH protein n=1 Tax=Paraburkholderia unamae TaxID=219649 RepID=A0ABX5KAJ3_9BURK|nr:MbtH family NRPS accessory protein [Paraburkholderia unamae]PVX70887.1 MbtH protein [Paraburkholderia unamae]